MAQLAETASMAKMNSCFPSKLKERMVSPAAMVAMLALEALAERVATSKLLSLRLTWIYYISSTMLMFLVEYLVKLEEGALEVKEARAGKMGIHTKKRKISLEQELMPQTVTLVGPAVPASMDKKV